MEPLKKKLDSSTFTDERIVKSFTSAHAQLESGDFRNSLLIFSGSDEGKGGVKFGSLSYVNRLGENLMLVWNVEIQKGQQVIFMRDIVHSSVAQQSFDDFVHLCHAKDVEYLKNLSPTENASGTLVPKDGIAFHQIDDTKVTVAEREERFVGKRFEVNASLVRMMMPTKT